MLKTLRRVVLVFTILLVAVVVFLIINTMGGGDTPFTQTPIMNKEEKFFEVSIGRPDDPLLTFHVIDVGQGSANLIESDGHWMIFDGGDRETSSKVVAYLKDKGVTYLDYIVASHYDADHIAGLIGVMKNFDYLGVIGPDYEADTSTYKSFMREITDNLTEKQFVHPTPGTYITMGHITLHFLAPIKEYEEENANSVVMIIECAGKKIYLGGDQTIESEKDMLKMFSDIRSDIYILNHHGSSTSSSKELLKAMDPDIVILSCGKDNEFGHPHASVMSRIKKLHPAFYRTDMQGDIIFYINEEGIFLEKGPVNDFTKGVMENDS